MKNIGKTLSALAIGISLIIVIEGLLAVAGVTPLRDKDPFVGFKGSSPVFIPKPDHLGTCYLNPAKETYFNKQEFRYPKPQRTFRIMSFGGSTTYGRPYINNTSFPHWISGILNNAQTSINFENINMGGISYASYRVRILVRGMAAYSPDLYVLYSGHNEFLESRTFQKIRNEPETLRKLRSFLHRSRIYTVISGAVSSLRKGRKTILPGSVNARLEEIGGYELYHRDPEFRKGVIAQYRDSIEGIIRFCRKKNIPLILCTLPSNLTGVSPFKSEHRPGLSAADLGEWNRLIDSAEGELGRHDFAGALNRIRSAEKIDGSFAYLQFIKGRILMELGRYEEAGKAFLMAKEEDIVPLRALETFNNAIRTFAERYQVPLADVEAAFRNVAPNGLPGNELFVDHVHPTIKGQQLIAWTVLNTAEENRILPFDPLRDELSREKAMAFLKEENDRVTPRYRAMGYWGVGRVFHWAGKYPEARTALLKAWDTVRDVAEIPLLLGDIEIIRRNPRQAMDYFQKAQEIGGEEVRTAYGMATAAIQLSEGERALGILNGIPPAERSPIRHLGLSGEALLLAGRTGEAVKNLEAAIQKAPEVRRFLFSLARAYVVKGDESYARKTFNKYAELSGLAEGDYGDFRRTTLDKFHVQGRNR
ncbi:tetratricopeptide repeat protein [bacterium BMS3Abin14]|nr:tetratricopeptide repeat protein [bacterium BMS3Abin14]